MIRIGNLLVRSYDIVALKYLPTDPYLCIKLQNSNGSSLWEGWETIDFDTPEEAEKAFQKLLDELTEKPLEYQANEAEEAMPSLSAKVEMMQAKIGEVIREVNEKFHQAYEREEKLKLDLFHKLELWVSKIERLENKLNETMDRWDKWSVEYTAEMQGKIDILYEWYNQLTSKLEKNQSIVKDLFLGMPDVQGINESIVLLKHEISYINEKISRLTDFVDNNRRETNQTFKKIFNKTDELHGITGMLHSRILNDSTYIEEAIENINSRFESVYSRFNYLGSAQESQATEDNIYLIQKEYTPIPLAKHTERDRKFRRANHAADSIRTAIQPVQENAEAEIGIAEVLKGMKRAISVPDEERTSSCKCPPYNCHCGEVRFQAVEENKT